MAHVQLLSEEIIRGIAAGEVVERPASVLKELLENSLDAGAKDVRVEWAQAGRGRLSVADDGQGMTPADAVLSLQRHATSKIHTLDDLEHLTTFGFRGEALPSIAAVSRFQIITRPREAAQAWSVELEAGQNLKEGPAGAPVGTTVVVRDLFFATPARLKFLKSDGTERGLLQKVLEESALASTDVSFRVRSEGRDGWDLPAFAQREAGLKDRLSRLWGAERVALGRAVQAEGASLHVSGWVSDIQGAQPTARYQRFYVNHRPIQHRRLLRALYQAYHARLPTGAHPWAALFLEIDPAQVDVNVHPSKREVRFANEEEVLNFVTEAVRRALSETGAGSTVKIFSKPLASPVSWGERPLQRSALWAAETRASFQIQSRAPQGLSLGFVPPQQPSESPVSSIDRASFREARFEVLCQMHLTYIAARWEGAMYIVDQHAAAERALYEHLVASREGSPSRQPLLLPWVWEPSPAVAEAVKAQRDWFERLGFGLEDFGPASFRVTAVPSVLGDGPRVRETLEGVAAELALGREDFGDEARLIRAACLGSVRAGDRLEAPAMASLLKNLQACESPWSCPHGRPTLLHLSSEELARRFKRV